MREREEHTGPIICRRAQSKRSASYAVEVQLIVLASRLCRMKMRGRTVASQTSNFLNSGKHGEAPSMFSSNFRFMYRAAT